MQIKQIYAISANVQSGQDLIVGTRNGRAKIACDNFDPQDLWTADTLDEIQSDIRRLQPDFACKLRPVKLFVCGDMWTVEDLAVYDLATACYHFFMRAVQYIINDDGCHMDEAVRRLLEADDRERRGDTAIETRDPVAADALAMIGGSGI